MLALVLMKNPVLLRIFFCLSFSCIGSTGYATSSVLHEKVIYATIPQNLLIHGGRFTSMNLSVSKAKIGIGGAGGDIGGGGGDIGGGGGDKGVKNLSAGDIVTRKNAGLYEIVPKLMGVNFTDFYNLILRSLFEQREELENFQRQVIGSDVLRAQGLTGKNVGIAIIDSGIFAGTRSSKQVKVFKDFTSSCANGKVCDGHSHGTAVADIVYQMAPEASLIILKTLDKKCKGKIQDVIKAFRWALENKEEYNIKIINLSLEGPDADLDRHGEELRSLIKTARAFGIFVVAAVGNEGADKVSVLPGNSSEAIVVGSFNHQFLDARALYQISPFTNKGLSNTATSATLKPDVLAPGQSVYAQIEPGSVLAYRLGRITKYYSLSLPEQVAHAADMLDLVDSPLARMTIVNQFAVHFSRAPEVLNRYLAGRLLSADTALLNGTSFATASVSGGLAQLLQQQPSLQPEEFMRGLETKHVQPRIHYFQRGAIDFSKFAK